MPRAHCLGELKSCAITTAAAPCAAVTSGLFQGAQCCVFGYGALAEAPDGTSYPGLRVLKPGDRIALDRAAQVASLERVWAANNAEGDDQHGLEFTGNTTTWQATHLSKV